MKQFVDQLMALSPRFMKEFLSQDHEFVSSDLVSISELWALDFVIRNEAVTMRELAQASMLKCSSATTLVDRLLERGFVKRERSEEDRRVIHVLPASKGRAIWQKIQEKRRECLERVFGVLSEKEREQYLKILEKVVSHLEESDEK